MLIADGRPASYVAKQISDSVETTPRTYTHLFDEAEHAEQSRAAMDESFGSLANTWQTQGQKGRKRQKGGCGGYRLCAGRALETVGG